MDFVNVIKELTGKDVIYRDDLTDTWKEWFAGNVAKFHSYDDYNGMKVVKRHRKTLNMAKRACEDWANLLLNEKTDIAIGDENNQTQMTELLNKLNFWTKGNQSIEIAFALGQGAWVESVDDKGKSKFQFVDRTKIYPLTVEDDKITECAFANVNKKTFVLQIHQKDENGKYVIRTIKGKTNDQSYDVESEEKPFETKTDIPWFQFIKPNIVNNIDLSSPMGISIYANAIDALKGIDVAYTDFVREMELGKARVNVNKAVTYNEKGEVPTFDNDNELFYYTGSGDNAKEPFSLIAPPLRLSEFTSAINNALNIYSTMVGFGANHYRYDQNGVSTATQIVSENSEMFRTLKKHEILLQDAMIGMLQALMYIENNFGTSGYYFDEKANIEIKFDDSIIEDKEQQKINDRQDVNMGVMSKVEYRSKWYAEDIDTAQEKIDAIAKNLPSVANYFSELGE